MKKSNNILIIVGVLVLVLAVILPIFLNMGGSGVNKKALITLDINPNIEILTGTDGKVTNVNGINNDGKILAYGLDGKQTALEGIQSVIGKTYEEALAIILDEAKNLGLIPDTKEVNYSIAQVDENATIEDEVIKAIKDKGLTEKALVDAEVTRLETEHNISKQKATLVKTAMTLVNLTEAELVRMDTDDLLDLIEDEREIREDILSEELEDKFESEVDRLELAEGIKAYEKVLELLNNETSENIKFEDDEESINREQLVSALTQFIADAKNPNLPDIISSINSDTVSSDENLSSYITEIKTAITTLEVAIENLDTLLSGSDKEAYEAAKDALEIEEDALEDNVENLEEYYNNLHQDIDLEVEFDIVITDGKVEVVFDETEAIEEVIEKLEESFEDAVGIELDDIAEYYENELKTAGIKTEEQIEKEVLESMKTEIDALKAKIEEDRKALKDINENN